eukprot:TRINITY_DN658_c2_g3_i1.p1 TRINITY_DN658_c2_g3~~TRINITY_DN658_c2_g3_i1.p1  ORF type:complete len:1675 (+),score=391.51 TRINITY_DN658_c2_g3_i1:362-5386(+)
MGPTKYSEGKAYFPFLSDQGAICCDPNRAIEKGTFESILGGFVAGNDGFRWSTRRYSFVDDKEELISFGIAKQDCNGRSEFICPTSLRSMQVIEQQKVEAFGGGDVDYSDDVISEETPVLQIFRLCNQTLWMEREMDNFYLYASERTSCLDQSSILYWTSAMEESLHAMDNSIISITKRMKILFDLEVETHALQVQQNWRSILLPYTAEYAISAMSEQLQQIIDAIEDLEASMVQLRNITTTMTEEFDQWMQNRTSVMDSIYGKVRSCMEASQSRLEFILSQNYRLEQDCALLGLLHVEFTFWSRVTVVARILGEFAFMQETLHRDGLASKSNADSTAIAFDSFMQFGSSQWNNMAMMVSDLKQEDYFSPLRIEYFECISSSAFDVARIVMNKSAELVSVSSFDECGGILLSMENSYVHWIKPTATECTKQDILIAGSASKASVLSIGHDTWMIPYNLANGTIVSLDNSGAAIRIMPSLDSIAEMSFIVPYPMEASLDDNEEITDDGISPDPSLPCVMGTYGNNATICPQGSFCPGDCYKHYCSNAPTDVPARYHKEGEKSDDCNFQCLSGTQYRVNNSCVEIPRGFFSIDGADAIRECAAFLSPPHTFISESKGTADGNQYSCDVRHTHACFLTYGIKDNHTIDNSWTASRESIELMSKVLTTWLDVALGSVDSAFVVFSVRPFLWTTLERDNVSYVLNETSFGVFGMYRIFDVAIELLESTCSSSSSFVERVRNCFLGRITVEFDYSRMIRKSSWFRLDSDEWMDIAIVFDGKQEHMRFYVNGEMKGIDVFFKQSAIHVDSIQAMADSLESTLTMLQEQNDSNSIQMNVEMPFAVHLAGFDGMRTNDTIINANDHMPSSAILFGEYAHLMIGKGNPPLLTSHEASQQTDRSSLVRVLDNMHLDGISGIQCQNGFTEIWSNLQSEQDGIRFLEWSSPQKNISMIALRLHDSGDQVIKSDESNRFLDLIVFDHKGSVISLIENDVELHIIYGGWENAMINGYNSTALGVAIGEFQPIDSSLHISWSSPKEDALLIVQIDGNKESVSIAEIFVRGSETLSIEMLFDFDHPMSHHPASSSDQCAVGALTLQETFMRFDRESASTFSMLSDDACRMTTKNVQCAKCLGASQGSIAPRSSRTHCRCIESDLVINPSTTCEATESLVRAPAPEMKTMIADGVVPIGDTIEFYLTNNVDIETCFQRKGAIQANVRSPSGHNMRIAKKCNEILGILIEEEGEWKISSFADPFAMWDDNTTFEVSFISKLRLPSPTIRPLPQEISSNSLPISAAIGLRPKDNIYGAQLWRDVSFRYRIVSRSELIQIDELDVIGEGAVFDIFEANNPIKISDGDTIIIRTWKEDEAPSIKKVFSYANVAVTEGGPSQGFDFCEENATICIYAFVVFALLITILLINILWCICRRKRMKERRRQEGKVTTDQLSSESPHRSHVSAHQNVHEKVIESPTGRMESAMDGDGDEVIDDSPTKIVQKDITTLRLRRRRRSSAETSDTTSRNILKKHLSLLPGPAMCERCECVAIFRCVECHFDLCSACCAAHGEEMKGNSDAVAHVCPIIMQCSRCHVTVVPKLYKRDSALLCEDCKSDQERSEDGINRDLPIAGEEMQILHRCDVCGELEAYYEYERDERHLMLICYECAVFFPPTRMSIRPMSHRSKRAHTFQAK